ncbi:MAG: TRAP transporter TatT component family protein [Arenimonas sp.]
MSRHSSLRLAAIAMLLSGLAGCASVVRNASDRFAENLGNAVLDSEDPATVRDGLPSYLLLLDSLVAGQGPDAKADPSALLAAARLNSAYAGNFSGDDKLRARRLSKKAFGYARRAACMQDAPLCAAMDSDPDAFAKVVATDSNTELMYVVAGSWAGFLQANSEDWGAIADLPKIQSLLERVVALDPVHDHGQAWTYLGVLNSLRPEAIGGKPAEGRRDFEKAIELSGGRNLYAKTLFAEFYARLVFDQELHDRLLNEVLAADPVAPGFTLTNTLAQDRARKLLESGKDYF